MKTRLLWVAVVLTACIGFYFLMIKPAIEPQPWAKIEDLKKLRPPPPIPPPQLPLPVIAEPVIAPPEVKPIAMPEVRTAAQAISPPPVVPIQDGTTLDFSYGAPHIKVQGKEADDLQKALKEMAEATKDVSFEATKKQ